METNGSEIRFGNCLSLVILHVLVCAANICSGQQANERSTLVREAAFQEPLDPVQRTVPQNNSSSVAKRTGSPTEVTNPPANEIESALLGGVTRLDELPSDRKARILSPGSDAVIGSEAHVRETTDTGSLVGESLSVRGVNSQQRTPIITDTRVRGEHVGQVLAAGSFWAPARMDLDTMMSKIDSRLIGSLLVIKGPYSPRYGPGFRFVDMDMLATPRYSQGFESHGQSSVDYQTNGQQWYGRQTIFGGSNDWGFRMSYGYRAGSDITTGDGFTIPSSYKSGDANIALGYDLTRDDRLEFNYLRLDQRDLEFPGLVYDLNYLNTDGYEVKYTGANPGIADLVLSEVWYNRTKFAGDTFRPSKITQFPLLGQLLYSPSGVDGAGITDGDGASMGYRNEFVFGQHGIDHWALGTDLIALKQGLNDIEISDPSGDNNYPIPKSRSVDFGFFAERILSPWDGVRMNAGGRIDVANANASQDTNGFDEDGFYDFQQDDLRQNFTMWSGYLASELDLTENWISNLGYGYAQRPPTLTELYAASPFIGSLQRGLTFLSGDPDVQKERMHQIDAGLKCQHQRFRGGFNAYQAWIRDFITYDLVDPPSNDNDGLGIGAAFVNTDLAVIRGLECYGRFELSDPLAIFGTLSYVKGDDLTRQKPSEFDDNDGNYRSGVAGVPREALPGIAPLDSRLGLLLHDMEPSERWGVELSARMVARQTRIARTLEEVETPGFMTLDLRSYRRFMKRNLLLAGVENLTDRFYREHLDYRNGNFGGTAGVFRSGINFYTGIELNY